MVIDKDKVAFSENTRTNRPIILTLDLMFVSLIGQGRITKNLEGAPIDLAFQIPDGEAVPIIFDLLEHEGLCLGGSSGINIAGALRLANELGPGHTIVTILADYGTRYQSKLFNPEFLREKKLPVPPWLERRSRIEVPYVRT